jgi:hypothetical protein
LVILMIPSPRTIQKKENRGQKIKYSNSPPFTIATSVKLDCICIS